MSKESAVQKRKISWSKKIAWSRVIKPWSSASMGEYSTTLPPPLPLQLDENPAGHFRSAALFQSILNSFKSAHLWPKLLPKAKIKVKTCQYDLRASHQLPPQDKSHVSILLQLQLSLERETMRKKQPLVPPPRFVSASSRRWGRMAPRKKSELKKV